MYGQDRYCQEKQFGFVPVKVITGLTPFFGTQLIQASGAVKEMLAKSTAAVGVDTDVAPFSV
jgi:hypothetical protein